MWTGSNYYKTADKFTYTNFRFENLNTINVKQFQDDNY